MPASYHSSTVELQWFFNNLLSLWASAMGNLGGYILVAKLASVLSAVGLGVGSTAAVSFVYAIGGPVTLAVGLASLLALAFCSFFGEDWQTRLAKQIAKTLQEKEFLQKCERGANRFWDQTLSAFEAGADEIERAGLDAVRHAAGGSYTGVEVAQMGVAECN